MSDDQNPQPDDHTPETDDLPTPVAPAPVLAASSTLPPTDEVPLTPVVGGGPVLKPDGGGENVAQRPWLWILIGAVALLIAAIAFSQCSGSEAPVPTSIVGQSQDSATTVTTSLSGSTTVVSVAPVTSAPVSTAPPTTGPPTSDGTGTVTGGGLTPAELAGLQAQCVYGNDDASCQTLIANGYTADTNYGLGDTLTSLDDATLSAQCATGVNPLSCSELGSRHPGTEADRAPAQQFADAVVAGDVATVNSLAAPYVTQQVPQLLAGPYGSGLIGTEDSTDASSSASSTTAGTTIEFNDGKFSFQADDTTSFVCWISSGVVVYCLMNG